MNPRLRHPTSFWISAAASLLLLGIYTWRHWPEPNAAVAPPPVAPPPVLEHSKIPFCRLVEDTLEAAAVKHRCGEGSWAFAHGICEMAHTSRRSCEGLLHKLWDCTTPVADPWECMEGRDLELRKNICSAELAALAACLNKTQPDAGHDAGGKH